MKKDQNELHTGDQKKSFSDSFFMAPGVLGTAATQ